MKKISFRKICHWLHLWLGLVSGIIVFIVAITGCIYMFQQEIRNVYLPNQTIEISAESFLSPLQLKEKATQYVYKTPADSVNSIYGVTYNKADKAASVAYNHYKNGYTILLLDPYTGKYITEQSYNNDFFYFILSGHRNLWLPYNIGHQIVGWAVIVFALVTITGLVLWMPKKWKAKAVKSGLVIRRKAKSFQRFFDLHKVLGFYTIIFALLFIITGLTWSFKWYAEGYYKLISGGKQIKQWELATSDTTATYVVSNPADSLWQIVNKEYPIGKQGTLSFDFPTDDKTGTYRICYNSANNNETYYKRHFRFFDQKTLKELEGGGLYGVSYENSSGADKFYRMTYDIHVGAIAGLPGRIVMFLSSLIIASLPITGFVIWWKKRPKKKEKK